MSTQHRLERRASLLGQRMRELSTSLANVLGAGDAPPFTTAKAKSDALDWWGQHRHDEYGAAALARLQPWEIAELDRDLGALRDPQQPGTAISDPVAQALEELN